MTKYICINYGSCPVAGKEAEPASGADPEPKCKECGLQLQVTEERKAWWEAIARRPMIVGLAGAAIVVIGVGGWFAVDAGRKPAGSAAALSVIAIPSSGGKEAPSPPAETGTAAAAAVGMPPDDKLLASQKQEADRKIVEGAGGAQAVQRAVIANEYVKAAMPLMQAGKWKEAEEQLGKAKAENPDEPLVYYNQAIVLLKQGRDADATAALEACLQKGFREFGALAADADLKPLTAKPEVAAMIAKFKSG